MAKVTGYKLREALQREKLRLESLYPQFRNSRVVFKGDTRRPLPEIAEEIQRSERRIAQIQTAQSRYNLLVTVQVEGQVLTLCEAVKSVGGAGRLEKEWRVTDTGEKPRYADYTIQERDPEKIYAEPAVGPQEASSRYLTAARWSSALRNAIATANATEVVVEFPAGLLD